MANPTVTTNPQKILDFDDLYIKCEGLIINGVSFGATAQSANVADASAPAAYSAHSSGSTPVTSNAATDLDTTAAALEALRDEVAALTTIVNSALAILEAQGLMADA